MAPKGSAILYQPPDPVPFPRAWAWQRHLQGRLLADPAGPEAVLLLEHEPCYTLGRGASLAHLRFDPAAPPHPLHRIDRGGEVTHHAPGQLVLYPVLDLQRHGADLHLYLRELEQLVIDLLRDLGLAAERREGLTGVWLADRKLAAIGVGARRWITQHGLALNVSCDLGGFAAIAPCGLSLPVGRLSDWQPGLSCAALAPRLLEHLAARFGLALRAPRAGEELEGLDPLPEQAAPESPCESP
ncbi:MAG: lipoyl(octanoyl) transferase LipB [Synechococcaceae cyanobacterium]|nr:lipoyl(octanoyl) transferase LipB [Synechococcaceae cyanobacterium]